MEESEWTTTDGRKYKVSEMDNNHLINAYRFVHNRCKTFSTKNPRLLRNNEILWSVWDKIFEEEIRRRREQKVIK